MDLEPQGPGISHTQFLANQIRELKFESGKISTGSSVVLNQRSLLQRVISLPQTVRSPECGMIYVHQIYTVFSLFDTAVPLELSPINPMQSCFPSTFTAS
jgi:hypothetical protein